MMVFSIPVSPHTYDIATNTVNLVRTTVFSSTATVISTDVQAVTKLADLVESATIVLT